MVTVKFYCCYFYAGTFSAVLSGLFYFLLDDRFTSPLVTQNILDRKAGYKLFEINQIT